MSYGGPLEDAAGEVDEHAELGPLVGALLDLRDRRKVEQVASVSHADDRRLEDGIEQVRLGAESAVHRLDCDVSPLGDRLHRGGREAARVEERRSRPGDPPAGLLRALRSSGADRGFSLDGRAHMSTVTPY